MIRRWNGWGREDCEYPLSQLAIEYLEAQLGRGCLAEDAKLSQMIALVPPSRLPPHEQVITEGEERVRHARGQSLPDWISLRCGRIATFPDGIAYPQTDQEVAKIIDYAKQHGVVLIPYGGGTSVLGHINPPGGEMPCLTLDMSRLNRQIELDSSNLLATFEAGVRGLDLEVELHKQGFTFGHYPQSFEFSTLGGWIATRSCGQQSYYYGRIEDNFLGGKIFSPSGCLELNPYPASAAGPDLRQLVLGSEGRFGVITQATIRIRPMPESEGFFALIFHDRNLGIDAVRSLAQQRVGVSMLRLLDPVETEVTFYISGKDRLASLGQRGLTLAGYPRGRCLLIFSVTGERRQVRAARRATIRICRKYGGLYLGSVIGKIWKKSRFLTPYLRNSLWEAGYALDTLETALPWTTVIAASTAVKQAISEAGEGSGSRVLVFSHVSHVYPTGASLYFTYLFPRSPDPDQMLEHWSRMKDAASRTIQICGGTISHQHGIGKDHLPFLEQEKGVLGIRILASIARSVDPQGNLTPGVLVPDSTDAEGQEG
jgi:alkyldihydroxyacetonephosphate synthase